MLDVLKQQYSFIKSTREILFEFLKQIPLQELQTAVPGFGSGSIIKTHIHLLIVIGTGLAHSLLGRSEQIFPLLQIMK